MPPPTESLSRTFRTRYWLVPTIVVVALLTTVIAAGKLGQIGATPAPPPAAAAPTLIVPGKSLTIVPPPVGLANTSLLGPSISIRTDGESYVDGIPTVLDGNQVVRVRDAASLPVGSNVLVGGWLYANIELCRDRLGPCPQTLSDIPVSSPRVATLLLGGQSQFNAGDGPRVYLATVQDDATCSFTYRETCLPELSVGDPVWQGDDATDASPIGPEPLLGELAALYPELDFKPFQETSYCPVSWPVQSYAVSDAQLPRAAWPGLPVRLVVIYPTVADLNADAPHQRAAAASLSAFDASNRCVGITSSVDDRAWVGRDNVMILLGPDDAVAGQVEATLSNLEP